MSKRRGSMRFATVSLVLMFVMLCLTGCGGKSKDYDIYFFNTKSEIADSLTALASDYEEETGVKVKVFTVGTTEWIETLRSEMNSNDYPTVFTSNAVAFEEWKSAGYTTDVSEIGNQELKALYESIPEAMQLQFKGEGNYGIPYNIEGYGLIADKQMIMDILQLDEIEGFRADYMEADYAEFEAMTLAMDQFINEGTGSEFTLNGSTYTTADAKTDLTENLNGVFSIAGAEKWTYGNHYGNYAISTVYKDIYDAKDTDESRVEQLQIPVYKSLKQLDFVSRYAAGPDKATERGADFINNTVTGYDQAVQLFAEGKAVFIKNGNWIFGNVAEISQETAENLMMLPVKMDFTDDDFAVEGLDAAQMNRSVPEFVSQYYIINAKATEEEKKMAEDFVLWLNTSETGQDYIINEFAFVPFNADERTVLENPLCNDLITYKREGNILANPFDSAPSSWGTESYGKHIMEELFTEPGAWDDAQLEEIAEKCVEYWKNNMERD